MVRRILFFLAGFLLAGYIVVASAETINATPVPAGTTTPRPQVFAKWNTTTPTYQTVQEVCDAYRSSGQNKGTCVDTIGTWSSYGAAGDCKYQPTNTTSCISTGTPQGIYGACPVGASVVGANCVTNQITYTCPDSSYTLTGDKCVRPDADKCAPTKDKYTSGWVSYTGDKVPTGTVCIADCNYEQNIMLDQDDRIGTDGRKWAQVGQTGLGTSCTGSTTPSMEPDQKNKDSKKPPCSATEGVLTTSTGKVLCVPEGTPDARKPDVKVKTKTETFPDNTTKQTTETTTRDPVTGATSTSTSSTSTGKADGTEGQAGPVGTTTGSSTSGSGNGDGDGEGCDPTLNFCGGPGTDGMYTKKEKTMASVFTQFQNTVKNSPVGSASTDFFAVSTPGGSCPAWSVQVPMLNVTLNAGDYFCNGTILAALQGAGYVMLALATYIAFTWAFL